jgi:hypothetical protein
MRTAALSMLVLVATSSTALGDDAAVPHAPPARTWSGGLKVGYMFEGDAYLDNAFFEGDIEIGGGLVAVGSVDAVMAPRFSAGAFALLAFVEGTTIATVGATLKGRFRVSPAIEVRPGLALGYQSIVDDNNSFSTTKGFDIGAFLEVAFPRGNGRSEWLLEAGFITQPIGGSSEDTVTFGPIFYVGVGLGWGN